jgi:hypothetical protein
MWDFRMQSARGFLCLLRGLQMVLVSGVMSELPSVKKP